VFLTLWHGIGMAAVFCASSLGCSFLVLWSSEDAVNPLAGVLAGSCILLIACASAEPVRRRCYEATVAAHLLWPAAIAFSVVHTEGSPAAALPVVLPGALLLALDACIIAADTILRVRVAVTNEAIPPVFHARHRYDALSCAAHARACYGNSLGSSFRGAVAPHDIHRCREDWAVGVGRQSVAVQIPPWPVHLPCRTGGACAVPALCVRSLFVLAAISASCCTQVSLFPHPFSISSPPDPALPGRFTIHAKCIAPKQWTHSLLLRVLHRTSGVLFAAPLSSASTTSGEGAAGSGSTVANVGPRLSSGSVVLNPLRVASTAAGADSNGASTTQTTGLRMASGAVVLNPLRAALASRVAALATAETESFTASSRIAAADALHACSTVPIAFPDAHVEHPSWFSSLAPLFRAPISLAATGPFGRCALQLQHYQHFVLIGEYVSLCRRT
jgi:hypothetical protein